ncbi:MAG TPA: hypothetical protein VG843_07165 [Rhizomicrobium sp.]|nr:hypothetical protein [Rhizomicrobium sp.]
MLIDLVAKNLAHRFLEVGKVLRGLKAHHVICAEIAQQTVALR